MTEQELLAVLDMSEDSPEQYGWLLSIIREHKACCPADLAFRLRDEAKGRSWNGWLDATKEVWKTIHKYWAYEQFWMSQAKPIHWIIAALIAKGKEDE